MSCRRQLVLARYGEYLQDELSKLLDVLARLVADGTLVKRLLNDSDMSTFMMFLNGFLLTYVTPAELERLDLPRMLTQLHSEVMRRDTQYMRNVLVTLGRMAEGPTSPVFRCFAREIYLAVFAHKAGRDPPVRGAPGVRPTRMSAKTPTTPSTSSSSCPPSSPSPTPRAPVCPPSWFPPHLTSPSSSPTDLYSTCSSTFCVSAVSATTPALISGPGTLFTQS